MRALLVALLLLLPVLAFAGELTLAEALAEADARGPSLAAARAAVQLARGEEHAASPLLPSPELSLELGSGAAFDAVDDREVGATLEVALPIFGTRGARLGAASARLARAKAVLRREQGRLHEEVGEAFVEVVAAREVSRVRDELATMAERLRAAAVDRRGAGLLPPTQVSLARVEEAAAQSERAAALRDVRRAEARLCLLLGRASCALPALVPATVPDHALASEAELIETALAHRPERAVAKAAIEAADRSLSLARRSRIPVPTLGLGVHEERGHAEGQGPERRRLASISLGIPLPLFGTASSGVGAAEGELSLARAEEARVRAELIRELRVAHAEVIAARESARRWSELAPVLTETLAWLHEGFSAGVLSLESYLSQRDRIVRGQLEAIASRRELARAFIRLARATGEGALTKLGSAPKDLR